MRVNFRHRMSKPSLIANEDVAEIVDHQDRAACLDAWHAACWENFLNSDVFDE